MFSNIPIIGIVLIALYPTKSLQCMCPCTVKSVRIQPFSSVFSQVKLCFPGGRQHFSVCLPVWMESRSCKQLPNAQVGPTLDRVCLVVNSISMHTEK